MWTRTRALSLPSSLCFVACCTVLLIAPSISIASEREDSLGAIVAIGDSFASGEAGRWLGNSRSNEPSANGTDRMCILRWWGCELRPGGIYRGGPSFGCHRADTAPVELVPGGFSRRVNLACSGATTHDIIQPAESGPAAGLPSQAERLEQIASRQAVSVVLLTIGANDLGFSELVTGCAEAWIVYRPRGCRLSGDATLEERIPGVRKGIGMAVGEVVSAMTRAGESRGDWELIVAGYASPLPQRERYRYPEGSARRLFPGGCPFTGPDSDWAERAPVSALNQGLSRAARDHEARFLDLSRAFDGHKVCESGAELVGTTGPSAKSAEWFRFLVPCCGGERRESLHPNAFGQRAIALCLGLFLAETTGRRSCRGRSGSGLDALRLGPFLP